MKHGKRFSTVLAEVIGRLSKTEKVSPTEIYARAKAICNGKTSVGHDLIVAAFNNPQFQKEVGQAYDRSESQRVIIYFKKSVPRVMSVERMEELKESAKRAQDGVRRYWAEKKKGAKKELEK